MRVRRRVSAGERRWSGFFPPGVTHAESMTTSAIMPTTKKMGQHALPYILFFEADDIARRALLGNQRYRRTSVESLKSANGDADDVERVVLVSSERLLAQNYDVARGPNLRVIALSETRFRDPRVDGAVYAYVPPTTPNELLERMVDNAVDHIHLLTVRRDLSEKLAGATREIHELNQIGAALSAEHDTEKLLEKILTKCREITLSDAGSLYLVEAEEQETSLVDANEDETGKIAAFDTAKMSAVHDGKEIQEAGKLMPKPSHKVKKRLRFKLTQNDSVSIPFRETTMEISPRSIAGYVALTGNPVNIQDAYHMPDDVPYTINRKFDEDSGYRTKSILAVPMRNQKDEIVGVVQLLNAKRHGDARLNTVAVITNEVVTYSTRQQEIVTSLASQAAVALENSRLYQAIQTLFEGFVKAAVTAIESRDPTTSGHSFRVANLTVALAEAVDRVNAGPYSHVRFSRAEMKEIRYASLLHDFGKVGVREEVLVKAKKLYPAQLDLIRQRFHFVKRSIEMLAYKSQLDYALEKGREDFVKQQEKFDATLVEQLKQVDEYFKLILQSNEPTVLPEGNFDKLLDIAARHFLDFEGNEQPLLTPDEVKLLSIRKGSLDDQERLQIESHVVHTFNFLKQIPWTTEIRNIPDIARGHHEKLNGRGYPYKLSAQEIPLQTRMMTISDIFDALSAADRPYKKAISTDRALEILGLAVKDGELDPALFQLFLDAKVFEKWKIEPYPY
jgi:HD-GYP domain-containing protein (c-di-GMP phosphodiesterase class II)